MPLPSIAGVPLFEGANATEFFDRFEDLCKDYGVSDEDKLRKLPYYCSRDIRDTIISLKEWEAKDYTNLRKRILKVYKAHDSYQQTLSLQFLEKYKSVSRSESDNILRYCWTFHRVASHLIQEGILLKCIARLWFLHGLPLSAGIRAIRECEVDIEDLKTIDYGKIYTFVEKSAWLEKSINKFRTEKTNTQNNELKDLVDRFQAPLKISKEKKLSEPVVPQPIVSVEMNNMETMTQQLQELSVSIGAFIQQDMGRGQFEQHFQPIRAQGTHQYQQERAPIDLSPMGINAFASQDMTNTCFYCYNRFPEFPPHRFRNKCP
jgi:hypothetical protein